MWATIKIATLVDENKENSSAMFDDLNIIGSISQLLSVLS